MKTLLIFALALFSTLSLQAQFGDRSGTEFWLCFDKNYRDGEIKEEAYSLRLQLDIHALENARVHIDIESINFHQTVSMKAHDIHCVYIPSDAVIKTDGLNKQTAIHVHASGKISVAGYTHRMQTTDSYSAIPVSGLGKEYRLASFTKLSQDLIAQASVIATEDNTSVEFTPTQPCIKGIATGSTQRVMLNKGDVYHIVADYQASATADITGSRVIADKNIAVFSGHSCAYVPVGAQGCNVLVEQLAPVSMWGKNYHAVQLPERSRYSLRVVSAEANTEFTYRIGDGELSVQLNEGEFKDIVRVRGNMTLHSNKPVMVMQYSHGYKDGDSTGDPCMIMLRPTEHYQKQVDLVLPDVRSDWQESTKDSEKNQGSYWRHYALIVAPTSSLASLKIDGTALNTTSFLPVDGAMSAGSILLNLNNSSASIKCSEAFSVVQYGIGYRGDSFDAYGHGW